MDSKIIYNKIKDILPDGKIDAIYLFGSYANGTFTDESDIDIAIFSDDINYIELVDLEDKIGVALNKEIDLVLPEKENVLLLREILSGISLGETTTKFDIWFERFNEWLLGEWWFIENTINERCGLYEQH
ncbi:MAG: type VII toxin-antitoxin system MntA family adenylyltransferase antitoxin [Clostridium sp.]